jgi:hypothetical protein
LPQDDREHSHYDDDHYRCDVLFKAPLLPHVSDLPIPTDKQTKIKRLQART